MAQAKQWPNRLGWDVGTTEVWKHANCLRVIGPFRRGRVTSTSDPVEAARIINRLGFLVREMEQLSIPDRNQLWYSKAW